jgi:hypothetical protein
MVLGLRGLHNFRSIFNKYGGRPPNASKNYNMVIYRFEKDIYGSLESVVVLDGNC